MKYTPAVIPEGYFKMQKRSLLLYWKAFPHAIFLSLLAALVAFTPQFINIFLKHDVFARTHIFDFHILWALFFDICFLIFFIAILWRLQTRIAGKRDTLFKDIWTACKKLPRIFVASLIQIFCVNLVNLIALVAFGIFLSNLSIESVSWGYRFTIFIIIFLEVCAAFLIFFMFYFYIPLILTEQKGIIAALKKSVRLVWGNITRTILFQITPWLVYLGITIIIRGLTELDSNIYFIQPGSVSVYSVTLHMIIFAIIVPWLAANFLVQLRDLELRKGLFTL